MSRSLRLQKHMRELLRELPGWGVVGLTGKKHYLLRHDATGARMTVGCSPSDVMSHRNTVRLAKRLERVACLQTTQRT